MTHEQRILRALAINGGEMYGLDLVAARAAKQSWMYVVLARLEDKGWIESRFADGDPPRRRMYRITDAGRGAIVPELPVAKVR